MILSVHAFPDKLTIVTSSVKSDPPNLGLSSAKITFAPFFAAAYALDNPVWIQLDYQVFMLQQKMVQK